MYTNLDLKRHQTNSLFLVGLLASLGSVVVLQSNGGWRPAEELTKQIYSDTGKFGGHTEHNETKSRMQDK
jgi:hypothetical protein